MLTLCRHRSCDGVNGAMLTASKYEWVSSLPLSSETPQTSTELSILPQIWSRFILEDMSSPEKCFDMTPVLVGNTNSSRPVTDNQLTESLHVNSFYGHPYRMRTYARCQNHVQWQCSH
jgi:hypothetical protein